MANPRGNPQNLRPWKPGQSGNPLGRSLARVELDDTFVKALLSDFKEHGAQAIQQCREKKPSAYLGVIARILPKELSVEVARTEENKQEHIDLILTQFSALQRERDEANERFQRLSSSIDGRGGDNQQTPALKSGS
jgi:hypothetical protein